MDDIEGATVGADERVRVVQRLRDPLADVRHHGWVEGPALGGNACDVATTFRFAAST